MRSLVLYMALAASMACGSNGGGGNSSKEKSKQIKSKTVCSHFYEFGGLPKKKRGYQLSYIVSKLVDDSLDVELKVQFVTDSKNGKLITEKRKIKKDSSDYQLAPIDTLVWTVFLLNDETGFVVAKPLNNQGSSIQCKKK